MVSKPWYQMSEDQISQFFDVDLKQGLTKKDALARLAKFGTNSDPTLSDALLTKLTTKVYRSYGVEPISIKQLALGDIVVLEEGDRVPADLRLVQVKNLSINQNAITGEPVASPKNTFAVPKNVTYDQQKCMAFAGSFIANGSGFGVVVSRGADSAIAKVSKKRTPRVGFRQRSTANKLQRSGVIILNPHILKEYKFITAVVIDAILSDEQIVEIIRKVQLTQKIPCKFIVEPNVANKLAEELGVTVYDANYPKADIVNAQFMVNSDAATSVKLVSSLHEAGEKVLWVTDGARALVGSKSANIVLAVGGDGRDDVRLHADILAVRQGATIITKIL